MNEKRENFKRAMSQTLYEDKDGEFTALTLNKPVYQVEENGQLSQALMDELRELKREELLNLEERIKNARLPTEDLFGIKRRFC